MSCYDRSFFLNQVGSINCFYREQLTCSQKELYDVIRIGLYKMESSIPVKGADIKLIETIYQKIRMDNPGLFFVESVAYQKMVLFQMGSVLPKYRFSEEQVDATLNAIYQNAQQLVPAMTSISEVEKEHIIHSFFSDNVIYDNSFKASSYECVGPLLFGKGVCEGISKAAKLLFDCCGIKSLVVHGNSMRSQNVVDRDAGHAWNILLIENNYYHLDITFDITVKFHGIEKFDYFNLSDAEMTLDHMWDCGVVPKCGISRDYYKKHGLLFYTAEEFKKYAFKTLMSGGKDIVFRLPVDVHPESASQKLLAIVQKIPSFRIWEGRSYQMSYNDTQKVFHIHCE